MIRHFKHSAIVLASTALSVFGCNHIEVATAEENCLLDSCNHPDVPTLAPAISVLHEKLTLCSTQPMTGFFRDGYCRTDVEDRGIHVVCAEMTTEFLEYTRQMGNDLSSPAPQYGFAGLRPGDKWCLCAARWYEAYLAGKAPSVQLAATDQKALQVVPFDKLKEKQIPEP